MLIARLRTLIRRGAPERPTVLAAGDLSLDPGERRVWAQQFFRSGPEPSPAVTVFERTDRPGNAYAAAVKVPQVTALFWVIKVLTTGMGETCSDFLARSMPPVIAVAIALGGLVGALVWQLRSARYRTGVYWFAVVMVSIFGTMAADVLHVILGIPYAISTPFFAVVLAVVLIAWYRSERTLSIHTVTRGRPELFYWATVLATFALGTAAGDLTATSLGWGYLPSGLVFAAAICVPALAFRAGRLNAVAAFWTAYVITRPLGASFADWMGVSAARGGLGWGTGPVTAVWAAVIVVLVAYLALLRTDAPEEIGQAPR